MRQVSVGGEVVRSYRLASESNYRNRKGEVDANLLISSLDELPPTHVARRNFKNSFLHRCLSCFRRGFLVIKAAVLNREPLPQGGLFPEPWPTLTPQMNVFQITLSTA